MKSQKNTLPQIDTSNGIEFGLYTLGDIVTNPHTGVRMSEKERIDQIIEMALLAEQAGMDVFQVGESHQEHFSICDRSSNQRYQTNFWCNHYQYI